MFKYTVIKSCITVHCEYTYGYLLRVWAVSKHVHGHVLSHKGVCVLAMASSQAADQPDTSAPDIMGSKEASEMEELRRVQIANEGMNLLLCSRLKEAEDLFRKSRLVARQLGP